MTFWILVIILFAVAGIMMFKPEWADRALGIVAAIAAALAAFGEKLMGLF